MNALPLRHIVEPSRLLLTWQPVDESARPRTRRTVGEVVRGANDAEMVFRYLTKTPDFHAAQATGFKGYAAFRMDEPETKQRAFRLLFFR